MLNLKSGQFFTVTYVFLRILNRFKLNLNFKTPNFDPFGSATLLVYMLYSVKLCGLYWELGCDLLACHTAWIHPWVRAPA